MRPERCDFSTKHGGEAGQVTTEASMVKPSIDSCLDNRVAQALFLRELEIPISRAGLMDPTPRQALS